MNGFLFPGQGSQQIGMGREFSERQSEIAKILDEANEILGYDLKELMFEGPMELLTDTRFAQPAIFTCSAMYLEKVKMDGLDYEYVAGHSLGEYSALLAAGVFSFSEGLQLVAKRGETMSRMNGKGTMAAVLGLTEDELAEYLPNNVVMANLNSKTQIVISGKAEDIEKVGEKLVVARPEVKFKRLQVSAAFHSPQMDEAAKGMAPVLQEATFHEPKCFVISNVTGKPTKDPNEIKKNLLAQITGQVRWYDTIMAMKEAGVSTLYEVGYGDVLKKLNKTITFRPKCLGIEV